MPSSFCLAKLDKLGGPETFNHYPWGWTWAGNTPFRRWKRETYRGGTSDPFIVHWPSGIKAKGEIRTQYAHAIDMLPTLLEVLSIEPLQTIKGVTQSPIEGVSFAQSFDDADAPTRHQTQYFEMFGHRSLYHDGWRAVCPWPGPSFTEAGKGFGAPISAETLAELDAHGWELYHVAEDMAENHNVAADNREKVITMIATWYVEAGKYKVLPIDGSAVQRLLNERPQLTKDRISYTYFQDTQTVPWFGAVHVLNRPHSITADVEIPSGGAQGVLICQGTGAGGFALYVKDGKLKYAHNYVSRAIFSVASQETVPQGRHQLRFEFEPTGKPDIPHGHGTPGRGQLYIDGRLVGDADIPYTTPVIFNPGGLTCGANPGLPVTPEYASPFKFTGKIYGVTVDVSGDLISDSEAEMRLVMARQ